MFALLLVLTALSGELFAMITSIGSVDPSFNGEGPWVVIAGSEFVIGLEADGTLQITAGSDVTANYPTYVGDYVPEAAGTTGTLLLTGSGSTFSVDPAGESELFIGPFATGYLTIADQAVLTSNDTIVGGGPEEEGEGVVPGEGHATVTGGGQWDTGWMSVGAVGFGELTVELGGSVSSEIGEIGLMPESEGHVTVDQAGSWTLSQDLLVGIWGDGFLTISEGGQVQSARGWIGGVNTDVVDYSDPIFDGLGNPDGTGTVLVTGENSLWDAGDSLVVGAWGTGDLTIEDQGTVTAAEVYIGGMPIMLGEGEEFSRDLLPTGTGTVTVTGAGSLLEVTGNETLYVGYAGTGTLNVQAGGDVMADSVVIGAAPEATGTVVVSGGGSTLTAEDIQVGAWGTGDLTVSGGGAVSTYYLAIGGFDASTVDDLPQVVLDDFGEGLGTGTVTVTGTGSTLDVLGDDPLVVGHTGQGTLEILAGGQVTSHAGIVGLVEGSDGLVTVDGTGSLWQITGGETATALLAQGDGEVIVRNGGQIIVEQTNGLLDVGGTLTVGSEGDDSSMTIYDGADVYSVTGVVGGYNPQFDDIADYFDPATEFSDGTGAVTVTDAGSRWETEDLQVGFSGDGALSIENGGYVLDLLGMVGVVEGVTGTVEVTGSGSTWDNLSDLVVGVWGTGDLTISAGGTVFATDAYIGGMPLDVIGAEDDPDYTPTGTGTVTVTGGESELIVTAPASLYVGYSGDGALSVLEGGYVESQTAEIAALPGSFGAADVNGVAAGEGGLPSEWQNSGSMVVGGYGEGYLDIVNGGEVYVGDTMYIGGFDPEAEEFVTVEGIDPDGYGDVIVAGEGSLLDVQTPTTLHVGYSGEGWLEISDSGTVISQAGYIGTEPGSFGAAIVTGGGSLWQVNGNLVVGYSGEAVLDISEGGALESQENIIAYEAGSYGEVTVSGPGATWTMSELSVGRTGEGYLTIEQGGQVVNSSSALLGQMVGGYGDALVTGADSQWQAGNILWVGYRGEGVLTIADGATVSSGNGVLGPEDTAVGDVLVTGESSAWVLSDDLAIGYAGTGIVEVNDGASLVADDIYVGGHVEGSGGLGTLLVNDDAEVFVGDELYVWQTGLLGGDGTVTVAIVDTVHNYGTIAPGDDGIGTLTVNGDVVFHEGSTYAVEISNSSADQLLVNGGVEIEGGTVQVASVGTIFGEHEYEIVSADSVVGEFNDLDTALLNFAFETIELDYPDEVSVWLRITAANFNDPNIARTDNQRQVAEALQGIAGEGGNDVTDAVQDLETTEEVRHAYDQLSGQTRAPLAPMTIAGSSKFLGTVTSRVQTVRTGLVAGAFDFSPLAAAGPDQAIGGLPSQGVGGGQTFGVGRGSNALADRRWGLWGRGYGLFGDRDTEGGVPGYDYDIYGASFGVDYQLTSNFLAGMVGGMSKGDVSFHSSRDNADFDAAHIGLYGSLACDRWAVDSVVTYANLDYETQRFVDVLAERLTGNFDGYEIAAYVEASRSFDLAPDLALAPLASVQYTYVSLDSYTETGGAGALSFDEQTHESVRGSLGARLTKRVIESAGDFRADLQVRGRWVHEFGDDRASVDTAFASDPAVVFTVKDEEISRDSAVLGAGLSAELSKQTRAYVDYDTRLNSDESVHVLSASLQYRW